MLRESYDANYNVRVYEQILEFFRIAPEARLYLFNSLVEADLKAFISQNKEIKGYGFNIDYDTDTPNLVTTINAHQTIINTFKAENRFIDFGIIGCNGLTVFTQDLFALIAPNISVSIACEDASGFVSVGSVLGGLAVRKVSENLGSVDIETKPRAKRGSENYTLTDSTLGRWENAYLSSGVSVASLAKPALDAIIEKGYIVAASYEGYPGFYFENSYTCIDRTSDYGFIENNRVWNKAVRIVRATLLPRVKSKVKKNPTTGFIASTTLSYWQGLLEKAINRMAVDDDISGFEVYFPPNQTVNSTTPVQVKVRIVADGIVHEFEVAVGLTNSI